MTDPTSDLTQAFLARQMDPGAFHHAEHVQVAFDLLEAHDFIDASAIYARGLQAIAALAGVPEKFNLTIAYAFMSLIAERRAGMKGHGFATFAEQNADVMSKAALAGWYAESRLHSDLAREVFLMPQALVAQDDLA